MAKVIDDLRLTEHYFGQERLDRPKYSLSQESVDKVLAELSRAGVRINPDCSEREVAYTLRTAAGSAERKVVVPLETQFPSNVSSRPTVIYLRNGEGLELALSYFDEVTSKPSEGVIGGSSGGKRGLVCDITIENAIIEDIINSSQLRRIKDAVRNAYTSNE